MLRTLNFLMICSVAQHGGKADKIIRETIFHGPGNTKVVKIQTTSDGSSLNTGRLNFDNSYLNEPLGHGAKLISGGLFGSGISNFGNGNIGSNLQLENGLSNKIKDIFNLSPQPSISNMFNIKREESPYKDINDGNSFLQIDGSRDNRINFPGNPSSNNNLNLGGKGSSRDDVFCSVMGSCSTSTPISSTVHEIRKKDEIQEIPARKITQTDNCCSTLRTKDEKAQDHLGLAEKYWRDVDSSIKKHKNVLDTFANNLHLINYLRDEYSSPDSQTKRIREIEELIRNVQAQQKECRKSETEINAIWDNCQTNIGEKIKAHQKRIDRLMAGHKTAEYHLKSYRLLLAKLNDETKQMMVILEKMASHAATSSATYLSLLEMLDQQ